MVRVLRRSVLWARGCMRGGPVGHGLARSDILGGGVQGRGWGLRKSVVWGKGLRAPAELAFEAMPRRPPGRADRPASSPRSDERRAAAMLDSLRHSRERLVFHPSEQGREAAEHEAVSNGRCERSSAFVEPERSSRARLRSLQFGIRRWSKDVSVGSGGTATGSYANRKPVDEHA